MTMIPAFSTSGTKLAPVKASDKVFKAKINQALMAQAVRVYLSNQRQASAKAKDRNDVHVTHAKVWRQKGTGRARHGSRNAPIFVGGAKAHGPSGTQNYYLKLSKKQRQASLRSALSLKFKEGKILVVAGLDKLELKTKKFNQVVAKLKLEPNRILLLLDKSQSKMRRAIKNLPFMASDLPNNLTTYSVLSSRTLIFTKEGLKCLD